MIELVAVNELASSPLITKLRSKASQSLGHEQSAALARWFAAKEPAERPNVLMCSPFVRARQTCTAVATALGIDLREIQTDERLREKEFGILDRHTRHGILSKFPELAAQRALVGKFYFRPPGGESWCDVILRVRSIGRFANPDEDPVAF